jgi:hypothetical protein
VEERQSRAYARTFPKDRDRELRYDNDEELDCQQPQPDNQPTGQKDPSPSQVNTNASALPREPDNRGNDEAKFGCPEPQPALTPDREPTEKQGPSAIDEDRITGWDSVSEYFEDMNDALWRRGLSAESLQDPKLRERFLKEVTEEFKSRPARTREERLEAQRERAQKRMDQEIEKIKDKLHTYGAIALICCIVYGALYLAFWFVEWALGFVARYTVVPLGWWLVNIFSVCFRQSVLLMWGLIVVFLIQLIFAFALIW